MRSIPVAGRPSDAPPRASFYAGSGRARRNSIHDDSNASQLSLENLGGSQDNLHMLGRNPDKEMKTHTGRRLSSSTVANNAHTSTHYIDNRELEEMEKHAREGSPYGGKQYVNLDNAPAAEDSSAANASTDSGRGDKVSFADLRKQKARDTFHSSGINITYNDEKEDVPKARTSTPSKNTNGGSNGAANLTSWASSNASSSSQQQKENGGGGGEGGGEGGSPGNLKMKYLMSLRNARLCRTAFKVWKL